jgi:PH (Pleckstrin Homology) domain-containing protein
MPGMSRCGSLCVIVIAIAALALLVGPGSVLAQAACAPDQPQVAPAFSELASRLGPRVGSATNCEGTDSSNGDVQQKTTNGLLYVRRSTNLPTFTDGGEHWALRSGQLLHWTTTDVDAPASAEAIPLAATPAAQFTPTATPRSTLAASGAAAPDLTAPLVATSLVVMLLAIVATFGLMVLGRGRRASGWAVQPGTQLATQTASVAGLQTTITDIGDGRATAEASEILARDPDATVVQVRPVALAVLFSVIMKWLLIILVGLAILSAVGQSALTVGLVAIAMIVVLLAYVPLSATEYKVTSQRVEITTGVLSRRTITRESYELTNAKIVEPLHYRIFGVGDLAIEDRKGGSLVLRAIRNPRVVRDVIRGSGQFEAARFEKANWR